MRSISAISSGVFSVIGILGPVLRPAAFSFGSASGGASVVFARVKGALARATATGAAARRAVLAAIPFFVFCLFQFLCPRLDGGRRRHLGHGGGSAHYGRYQIGKGTVGNIHVQGHSGRLESALVGLDASRSLLEDDKSWHSRLQGFEEFRLDAVYVQDGRIDGRKGDLGVFDHQFLDGLLDVIGGSLGSLQQQTANILVETLASKVLGGFNLFGLGLQEILERLGQHGTRLQILSGNLLGWSNGTTDKDDRSRLFAELESTNHGLSLIAAGHGNVAIHEAELGGCAPVRGGVLEDARDGIDGALGITQDGIVGVARGGVLPEEYLPDFELVGRRRHVHPQNLLGHHALEQMIGEHGQGDSDEWLFVLVQGGGLVAFRTTLGGGFGFGHFGISESVNQSVSQ